ncbi:unnamed protein product, partial [Ectocarpus sp. 8 AP-2014]
ACLRGPGGTWRELRRRRRSLWTLWKDGGRLTRWKRWCYAATRSGDTCPSATRRSTRSASTSWSWPVR